MRIGIVLPIAEEDAVTGVPSYAEIRAVAVAAEAAGLDSVWVFDHLLFRFDGETTGIHECWTILAAIAEATSRVELGTIVLCTGFRNAALLAKMAATLDHVSGGRLILGIGAGWHDPEFEAFGYPTDHKVGRFEESLAVITGLIRDGRADLDGRFMTARDAVLLPPARPGPADPRRGQGPAHARARRPSRRRLEPGLVRAARRAARARSWRARGGLRARRAATRRRSTITVGVTVRYPAGHGRPTRPPRHRPACPGRQTTSPPGCGRTRRHGAEHVIASLEPCTPETVAAVRRGGRAASARAEPLAVLDPLDGEARPVARCAKPAQLEQPDDPRPHAAVRLEQLEHPVVRAARLAGQRVRHEVRQVEVADAHRVLVAQRPDADLGRRPRPDSRARRSVALGLGEGQVHDRLEPRRPRRPPAG